MIDIIITTGSLMPSDIRYFFGGNGINIEVFAA